MKEFFEKYGELYEQNPKSYRVFVEGVTDIIASVALYITIALAAALIVWAVVVRNRDESYLKGVRKSMLGIVVGYAVGVITVLGALRLYTEILAEHITWHAWLYAGLFALLVAAIAVTTVLHKLGKSYRKWVTLAFAVAIVAFVIVILCVVKPVKNEYEDYTPLKGWLMYLLSALLVSGITVLAVVGSKSASYNTKAITYAAVCVAISFALSYIKFFSMPQGGSVTFASLLPLALYSYMFGTRRGVIAGVVYGFLQFIQSPQFYQPMQVLLDYPIAFGAIGVAGLGRRMKFLKGNAHAEFAVGATIAVLFRYISHVLSGYFVFYSWAGEQNPLVYSLVYNTYTLVDLAIVLVFGMIVLSSKQVRRMVLSADSAPDASTESAVVAE